jgi:beta-lactamase class A
VTRHYSRVSRTELVLFSLATAVIVAGVSLLGVGLRSDGSAAELPLVRSFGSPAGPVPGTAVPTSTGPDPAERARQERQRRVKALDVALKKYAADVPEFSVAVLDRKTGERYSYRGTQKYDTASIVKVQVLACLLLKAQDGDRELTSSELSLAKRMIRLSDNNATTELFSRLGRVGAVTKSNKRLGLTATVVNSSWGLTKTTVNDQVRLLAELVDPKSPLDAESRELAFELMTTVDKAQRWGVSAAATPGETTAIKNGWDTRSTDRGLWAVNSVGRITGRRTDVSVAVLSHGHASQGAGITVVEKVAQLTRKYLKY